MEEKKLEESEIILLIDKSLKEVKISRQIKIIKKKYLEKEGIIPQLFQQLSQQKDLAKKKGLGSLINK
jgi:type II secretory pathway predicted ATPase ExeA